MAQVCLLLHIPPADYWRMTAAEREALISEANRQAKAKH